jgi:hypothetical protein
MVRGEMKNRVERLAVTVILAEPGWSVVRMCSGDEEHPDELYEGEVIAWRIVTEERSDGSLMDSVHPVMADGWINDDEDRVYRSPKGRLFDPDHREFSDDADVLAHLQVKERTERKRTAT